MKPPAAGSLSVPLLIEAPIDIVCQPVTIGVPFPRGVLKGTEPLRLFDAGEKSIPLQTKPVARWPDGSVKWGQVDFIIERVVSGNHSWQLRDTGSVGTPPKLTIQESAQDVCVETGEVIFQVPTEGLGLISKITGNGFSFGQRDGRATPVGSVSGHGFWEGKLRVDCLEGRGPMRTSLQARWTPPIHKRDELTVRSSFFAGTALVRLVVTLHNPRRARHKSGLWDLGDPASVEFPSMLAFPIPQDAHHIIYKLEPDADALKSQGARFSIHQLSSGGENWNSRTHVNRNGKEVLSDQGYELRLGEGPSGGRRAHPVVSVCGPQAALTVALPEFWQQFPKRIEVDVGFLLICLSPVVSASREELQGGEQKTHTVWLHFGPPSDGPLPLEWVHQPAVVRAAPEWFRESAVLPFLAVTDPESRLDKLLAEIVAGPHNWFDKREIIDEYGWRNYGEVYADHENEHYAGPKPIISHYNNQYDVILGLLLQYFRTGDVRWWQLADPLARHVIDIDIYHTTKDRAAYNGGLFWHTDHYKDAATSTHRAYSKANATPGKPYGGGPSCEHNYTTGLLHYYYLTGDPLARDAVLELAGWVLHMDDGRRNILGLVDDGPTGLASATREPNYHGPGRGAGNSINALLDAWLLTEERSYLDYAETLIRRCIHPADDIAARDLLNVEDRWSYTVFLSVLCRYLDLKAEAGQVDFLYAYGQAALVHYAAWMAEDEQFYFDHPEKLEYPTETWAAQELRKGNVLRLAARHADEPLRGRLLERGTEFAERAWSDLLRFPSRFTTRPLAIMMREGTVDLYLRQQGLPAAPRPERAHDFGRPEVFVPQKERVKKMLKSPRGLLTIGLRLLNPMRWWSFLRKRS